jgi:hypothetical protein
MNATPILFENTVAYKYYQVMFPTVRDAGGANSMQISEVELLGLIPPPVKINFQQEGGDIPEGYLPDYGYVFGDRGNGWSYGWNMDSTGGTRNHNRDDVAPDERYDTLNHMEKGEHRIWEIELPNGTYDVFLVCGDSNHTDQINNIDIEGVVVDDPDGEDNYDEYSVTVEVVDGRLTIQMAEGASNAKIMFVDIDTPGPDIILVSGGHDNNADGVPDDFMWAPMLEAEGYAVDWQPGNWAELDDDKIAALNAADLVIVSRGSNSGDFDDGDEPTQWNSVTTPMILCNAYCVRTTRWKWMDTTDILTLAPVMVLADGTEIQAIDETIGPSNFAGVENAGNGTVLATGDGLVWIAEWEAGVEFFEGSGEVAGGPRMFFAAGTQDATGGPDWGTWNLTPDGTAIFLDAVKKYVGGN